MFPMQKRTEIDNALALGARQLAEFASRMLKEAGENPPQEVLDKARRIREVETILLDLRNKVRLL